MIVLSNLLLLILLPIPMLFPPFPILPVKSLVVVLRRLLLLIVVLPLPVLILLLLPLPAILFVKLLILPLEGFVLPILLILLLLLLLLSKLFLISLHSVETKGILHVFFTASDDNDDKSEGDVRRGIGGGF